MTDAIERLLERLQIGWSPDCSQIDPEIKQLDMLNWGWWTYFHDRVMFLAGSDLEGPLVSGPVLWIDEHLGWALADTGFYWLYDDKESDKVRYLGG
jgi:hypothetical protein